MYHTSIGLVVIALVAVVSAQQTSTHPPENQLLIIKEAEILSNLNISESTYLYSIKPEVSILKRVNQTILHGCYKTGLQGITNDGFNIFEQTIWSSIQYFFVSLFKRFSLI